MTLHDAIVLLLQDHGSFMTTAEIADEINRSGIYTKRNSTEITAFQIHGRTRNYDRLFTRDGASVGLADWVTSHDQAAAPQPRPTTSRPTNDAGDATIDDVELDVDGIESDLLDGTAFRAAVEIDADVPGRPGFYAIRIRDGATLGTPFDETLAERGHRLLYLGIATKSLRKRFLGQELRARGHGTFFRGIGAMLGFRPQPGSLVSKKNTSNYTFSPADNAAIIEWINTNLLVNWVAFTGSHKEIERALIARHLPLMNTTHNPEPMTALSELRAECRRIAAKPT